MKAAPLKGAAFSQIGELYRCEGFPQSKTARSRIRMERDDLEYRMSGGQSADRARLAPHQPQPDLSQSCQGDRAKKLVRQRTLPDKTAISLSAVAGLFLIFGFNVPGDRFDRTHGHQGNNRASEAPAGQPRAVNTILPTANLHQLVQFGGAVLEILYRADVRREHELSEGRRVMMPQMLDGFENSFVLANNVRRPPFDHIRHLRRGELRARGVAQSGDAKNAGGLEASIAPLVVFSAGQGMLDARVDDQQTDAGRKGNILHGLRPAIEKDGILLPAEDRGNLVQQTTADSDEFVFRFAAKLCQIERADFQPE